MALKRSETRNMSYVVRQHNEIVGIYRFGYLKSLPLAGRRRSYLSNVSIAIHFRILSMLINKFITIRISKICPPSGPARARKRRRFQYNPHRHAMTDFK
ncbi:hypothetical protein BDI4_190079 [Burkholderia diffusa]|nr:hypothetical protein BDI4_190079 [Burkholderia diffusa]